MSDDSRFASRKFLLAMLAMVLAAVWLGLGLIDSEQWVDATKWVVGLYFAGNIGATIATSFISGAKQ